MEIGHINPELKVKERDTLLANTEHLPNLSKHHSTMSTAVGRMLSAPPQPLEPVDMMTSLLWSCYILWHI